MVMQCPNKTRTGFCSVRGGKEKCTEFFSGIECNKKPLGFATIPGEVIVMEGKKIKVVNV